MNVAVINGSPRENGNTAAALNAVCEALNANGVATVRIEVGRSAVRGCIGCNACAKKRNRRCIFDDDGLNGHLDAIYNADGLLVGSPVYYSGITGQLKCMLDRVFIVARANGELLRHKVGAGVVAARRGGEIAAWDQLNKYFGITEMFIPSGDYWNMVFGREPGEAKLDAEGMHVMRTVGENMAWLLHAVAETQKGRPLPEKLEKPRTNFIRQDLLP